MTDTLVVERLAEEMAARWRAGERPLADEYLARIPDLVLHPDLALELVAEELTLRDEYRVPTTSAELAARFPRWRAQVAALLDCQGMLAPPTFPEPGDWLGDFHLGPELGRGVHGRVYLATQPALAGRPVVLKVGPDSGDEHLSLARLQHTHVVPLYSVHEFPDRRLRALCMPDFGGATLAEVLARLPAGGGLLGAVRRLADVPAGPAWGFLGRAAPADAACWIGACLADGMQYAHDRGLVHLDLKPSNVLIAADGVPMLLDFHLARAPLAAGETAPDRLGGTPGFMAPEHRAAVEAVRTGRPVPVTVDGRADVFALGVMLGEFLRAAGCGPSPGLADVLARCTAPAAADRYPTAGEAAADLRRHLADLPLKGVGNRSLVERWGKWRRRRPFAAPLGMAVAALLVIGGGLVVHADRLADRAGASLRDGRTHAAAGRYAEAAGVLKSGEALAEGLPFHDTLRADLRSERAAAVRAAAADEFHDVVEQLRVSAASEPLPAEQARTVGGRARELWDRREALSAALGGQPTAERDDRWKADLLDTGVLSADLAVRAAPEADRAAARRRVLDTLAEAERLLGPARPPRGAWGRLTAGRAHLATGDVDRATAEFDAALAADPLSLWANHYRGVCHLRLGHPTEAATAFAACVTLAPRAAWCVHNRGLAFAAAGRPDAAGADFDRAIALDPTYAPAYLSRAAVRQAAGESAAALADLDRAAAAGAPAPDVAYRKGVVFRAAGDNPAAVRSLRACLAASPDHSDAGRLLKGLAAGQTE